MARKIAAFNMETIVENLISFVSLFFLFNVFFLTLFKYKVRSCELSAKIFSNFANPFRPGKTVGREQHQIS